MFVTFLLGITSVNSATTTVKNVSELLAAVKNKNLKAGDVILIKGGTYEFTDRLVIDKKKGEKGNPIVIQAEDLENRPQFDFSKTSSGEGIRLKGCEYIHIKGIDVFKAKDNGMLITDNSKYNTIEFCSFYQNQDSGLQIAGGSSFNTILNCDSYYNADKAGENADGFACKLTAGTENKFIGCRAWENIDDGWDGYLRDNDDIISYFENCWAFKNGNVPSNKVVPGGKTTGEGNGFKTGGSDTKDLKHHATLTNCISAGNKKKGFDHNSNRGDITIYNCISTGNAGGNFAFSKTNKVRNLTVKNSVSYKSASESGDSFEADGTKNITHNTWSLSPKITPKASDFQSVDINELYLPRKADGSLPDINYLRPKTNGVLIDKGIDVGLTYYGTAPDLGAFEYNPDPTLPLDFIDFKGKLNLNGSIDLKWVTTNEVNTKNFRIERSFDGVSFIQIGIEQSVNEPGTHSYNFTDVEHYTGTAYYRIIQTDQDGTEKAGKTVVINKESQYSVVIYPNPSSGIFRIKHSQARAGEQFVVFNTLGVKVYKGVVNTDGTDTEVDISHLPKGIYFINSAGDNNKLVKH